MTENKESRFEKNLILRSRKIRYGIIAGAVVVMPLFSLIAWNFNSSNVNDFSPTEPQFQEITLDNKSQIRPSTTDTAQLLRINGRIEPSKNITILSPFEGVVSAVYVKIGDYVKAGSNLVNLDTSMIDDRYREAESAYIKAKIEFDKLKAWENGVEMQRARRQLDEARFTSQKADRDLTQAKELFDKGIIPRNEYEAALQEQNSRNNSVLAAEDELKTTEQQGGQEQIKMAELDLKNAENKLNAVKSDRSRNELKAPISGIITSPPRNNSSEAPTNIDVGIQLQKGSAIFNIADTSQLVVVGDVDEVDINHVRYGQDVIIESEALPAKRFHGKITGISAEASKDSNMSQSPKFKVRATFQIDDAQDQDKLKIGMSARLTVQVKSAQQLTVAPLDYVIDTNGQAKLNIIRGGQNMTVDVQLGTTTPTGVEIVNGIQDGDTIVGK